ncbi:G2 M phase-specific E3 ubiquitin- ligase-like isoform X1 [Labeo rohita]|uniref:G2 M phase-specific E3 ubiquitin-ligase-like isoform X1 n=1 Tax=Labeo rohita TaxID=84645 RepID=A0A498MAV7_LABRO|nr:G2 M phase-specific E3 ubiquitin- ligase-like isoform X1 [Labeo rohita]
MEKNFNEQLLELREQSKQNKYMIASLAKAVQYNADEVKDCKEKISDLEKCNERLCKENKELKERMREQESELVLIILDRFSMEMYSKNKIDSTPLSPHAAEFEKMPKSVCKKCGVTMPLQVLALHVDSCAVESENASEESPDEDIIYVSEEKKIKTSMELCPVCGSSFPEDMTEFHASICVDNCSREMENFSEWTEDAVAGPSHSREDGGDATSEQPEVAHSSNRGEGGEDGVAGPSLDGEGGVDAVLGRTIRQIKQFRRGLKDTKVWSLLQERPDVVPLMFPRQSEAACCPQTILSNITWPAEEEDDDDEDTYSLPVKCRIAEYLRRFIENESKKYMIVQFIMY